MSYARFSEGDVYVWGGRDGYCCQCCRLKPQDIETVFPGLKMHGDTWTETAAEMLEHLQAHRAAGHDVPERAFSHLRAEAEEQEWCIAEEAE